MHKASTKTAGGLLGECLKSIFIAVFKLIALILTSILKFIGIIATKMSELIDSKFKN